MLNKQQVEIADFLLKHLESRGGQSKRENYIETLVQHGINPFDIEPVIRLLVDDLKLIRSEGAIDSELYLKPEGIRVAKIGIVKYMDEIDQDKQLDRAAKKATIKGVDTANKTAKVSKILSIVAIVISIILPFLVVRYDNFINKKNDPTKSDTDRQNGKNYTNSQIPFQLTDTLFVEKLKYSFKHDSVFLNEVKQLINNDSTKN
jgi:hypothetical protein